MNRIFAIIVTYNGMQWIERCLSSLRHSSVPVTAIVIDNGSTDGTIDYIRTHFPEAILLPQDKNLGFGQANNIGFDYALAHDATHVLLLNQDAYLQPETIATLLTCDDGEHLLTPIHLNGTGEHIDSLFYNRTILESAKNNGIAEDALLHGQTKSSYEVEYANAACWFMPVTIIQRIGGFDPRFTQYGEDDNYIQRLHFHHIGIRLVPTAFIYHDRKTHGNEAVYQRGALYRKLLLIETNINLSRSQRCIQRTKTTVQEFGAALLAHRACRFFGEWICAQWKLTFRCEDKPCLAKQRVDLED